MDIPQIKTAGAVSQRPVGRPIASSAKLAQAEASVREGANAAIAIKESLSGNKVRK